MPKHVSKVIYKPDSQSTDEFTIIVNPVEVRRPPSDITMSIFADTIIYQYKKYADGGKPHA
jgi:hypothetical protein